jgi:hypothetical protein
MTYSLDDLRQDFFNLHRLTIDSPLYVEIEQITRKVQKNMAERLSYDLTDFDDSLQRAMICLTKPMSAIRDISPLQHYLVHEYERRMTVGQEILLPEFRRILYTIIRNELRNVHTDGYVETLVDRSVRYLKDELDIVTNAKKNIFRVKTASDNSSFPTPQEIRRIANKCSSIPKIPQTSAEKNSPVYSSQNLGIILKTLISSVNRFQKEDLFELFALLLTSWSHTHLSMTDESTSRRSEIKNSTAAADSEIGAHEFAFQTAQQIWTDLTENQRRFMHANTWDVQQEEIARRVEFIDQRNPNLTRKYKRPSIVNLQNATLSALKRSLDVFDREEQIEIIRILNEIAANYEF